MKTSERQKSEVRNYIKKWRPRLYLHQWEFSIHYHNDNSNVAAEIQMKSEYKTAIISIFDFFWGEPKEKREAMIVHELCHCIVQPLVEIACRSSNGIALSQQEIDYHKETVTQHIASTLFWK